MVQKSRSKCTGESWVAVALPSRPTGVWHVSPMSWKKRENREKKGLHGWHMWKSREREGQKGSAWVTHVTHAGGKQQGPQTSDMCQSSEESRWVSEGSRWVSHKWQVSLARGLGEAPTTTCQTSDACHSSDSLRRLLPAFFFTVEGENNYRWTHGELWLVQVISWWHGVVWLDGRR